MRSKSRRKSCLNVICMLKVLMEAKALESRMIRFPLGTHFQKKFKGNSLRPRIRIYPDIFGSERTFTVLAFRTHENGVFGTSKCKYRKRY